VKKNQRSLETALDLAGKKILVTGADGFIGSHLVEALVRDGHEVRAFVYYNSFNSWGWLDRCAPDVAGRFDVVAGDIRDPHGVREAMRGVDVVLHLAALIAIPFSYHSPDACREPDQKAQKFRGGPISFADHAI
jgi:nucleoside-diphosphate-sugar epimerase